MLKLAMWVHFVVYGLLGWSLEVLWTGLGSLVRRDPNLTGHTYLWMFPIYGLAAFVLEPLQDTSVGDWGWFWRGIAWTAVIFVIEYGSGWVLRKTTGTCPWDYSGCRFSVNGLIRLDYAPLWFGVGLLAEEVHRLLDRLPL